MIDPNTGLATRKGEQRGIRGLCPLCGGPTHNEREKKQYQSLACLWRQAFGLEADRTPFTSENVDVLHAFMLKLNREGRLAYAHKPNGEPFKTAMHPTVRASLPKPEPKPKAAPKPKADKPKSLKEAYGEVAKVNCIACGAQPGRWCRDGEPDANGKRSGANLAQPHKARIDLVEANAAGKAAKGSKASAPVEPKGRKGKPKADAKPPVVAPTVETSTLEDELALRFACPDCKVLRGLECKTAGGEPRLPHAKRLAEVRKATKAGTMPTDQQSTMLPNGKERPGRKGRSAGPGDGQVVPFQTVKERAKAAREKAKAGEVNGAAADPVSPAPANGPTEPTEPHADQAEVQPDGASGTGTTVAQSADTAQEQPQGTPERKGRKGRPRPSRGDAPTETQPAADPEPAAEAPEFTPAEVTAALDAREVEPGA